MKARGATPERPHVGGWSRPPGEQVPASPATMPATWVAWNEAERTDGKGPPPPRPHHLRPRPFPAALRKPGRVGVPDRIQKRIRAVDAVVDDTDLDPVAFRA